MPRIAEAVEAQAQEDEANDLIHHMSMLLHDPACTEQSGPATIAC